MTFTQLRAFATVARLGSLSAAADALGVSEPAVFAALGSLRRDLGDPLYERVAGGVRLTPGGERLAAAAAEILGLEDRMRREVAEARGQRGLLRLAVSAQVAEYVSAPLLDAFTRRWARLEVAQEVAAPGDFAALLADRRADVVLGPAPASDPAIEAVPFLRYKLVAVAAPHHRLAGVRRIGAGDLGRQRWLVGPAHQDLDRLLDRARVTARELGAFATEAAAQGAAAAGRGSASRSRTRSSAPCARARSSGSTSPARHSTGCGTRRRWAPSARRGRRTRSGASSRRQRRRRRSSPGRAACPRAASARRCT